MRLACVLMACVAGCSQLRIENLACQSDTDCPNGYECGTADKCETYVAPSITVEAVNATVFSAVSGHDQVIVTFDASRPFAVSQVSVTLAASVFQCAAYRATSPNYTCTGDISGSEPAGRQSITIQVTDGLGNSATAQLPVTLDFTGPAISTPTTNGPVFSAMSPHDAVEVSFTATDTQPVADVTATIGAQPMTCAAAGAGYLCQYAVTGHESPGTQGIAIKAEDQLGNSSSASAQVTFQFGASLAGPVVVTYESSTFPNLDPGPTAATVGSVINVHFTVAQPLAATPAVTVPQTSLLFQDDEADGGEYNFQANLTTSTLPPNGSYGFSIVLEDTVGNTTTLTPSTPMVAVDSTAPSAPSTRAGGPITYTRIPWGDGATEGVPTFQVDGVAGAAVGCAGILVTDPAGNAIQAGPVDGTGAFSVVLDSTDRPAVYASCMDAAFNLSSAAAVHNILWRASLGEAIDAGTPNTVEVAQDFLVTEAGGTDGGLLLGPLVQDPNYTSIAPQAALAFVGDSDYLTASALGAIWENVTPSAAASPAPRESVSMAYDSARGVTVTVGTQGTLGDTWEWNGAAWSQATPASAPPARSAYAVAYDAAEGVTVLFGGGTGVGSGMSDTWQWDGASWTQAAPAHRPPARYGAAMAYDSTRGVAVLFGGAGSDGALSDTWEWNGTDWSNPTPASMPSARLAHAMAYDSLRQVTVLCGGSDGSSELSDTWAWNGTTWTNLTPSNNNPGGRSGHGLAYDAVRRVTVLFGGTNGTELDDTWEWNGSAWTQSSPVVSPPGREQFAMAYDAHKRVTTLFGGTDGALLNDVWAWDGTIWTELTPDGATPPGTSNPVMAYDAKYGTSVLSLGDTSSTELNETWEWNGTRWFDVTPDGGSPPSSVSTSMTYDVTRATSVLFGGNVAGTDSDDTWEWSGETWTDVTPGTANPSPRQGQVMDYDSSRATSVMFGGNASGTLLSDTWQWNGNEWSNVTTSSGNPPARDGAAMVYDPYHAASTLFGGCLDGLCDTAANDTWEWSGAVWTDVTPSAPLPSPRSGHAMAFDSARGIAVLFGGEAPAPAQALADTWEWNGAAWAEVTPATGPAARADHAMTYDAARQAVVLFGGTTGGSDTWMLPSDTHRRVAEIAQFSFASANASAPIIQQVSVTAYAGGTGNSLVLPSPGSPTMGGEPVDGLTIAAWDAWSGGWRSLVQSHNGELDVAEGNNPPPVAYTTGSASEAARYLFQPGGAQTVTVALFPTYGRGNGVVPPGVAADYLELSVAYVQP